MKTEVQLDSGAEVNVISQRFAVEEGMKPIKDAKLPRPTWMDGNSVYCYGAHRVKLSLCDSWGHVKEFETIFYAIDKEGPPLLLGMPGLAQEGIVIDLAARTWRFKIEKHTLELVHAHKFAKSLLKQPEVYALMVADNSSPLPNPMIGAVETQTGLLPTAAPTVLPEELIEYQDVFSTEEAGRLPSHQGNDHAIETTADPPYGPLYNLSTKELEVLRTYLDDALAKGWIQHSTSPAGAPILFVPKKDGGLRLCVDYRGLNKVTVKNRHPLPLISETLDRLNGAKVFTKLDLKDAYHRIRIRKGDEWKTAFRTRYGHFEYMVMPFGLTNAPATFQAYINKALAGLLDEFCVVYLDDILIFSNSEEEHIDHVRQVLQRLRQFKLYANPKKCQFLIREVEFLGFIVSTEGVAMDKSRIDTIQNWPRPKTYHEVQVFLGFVNFFRRFIRYYSRLAAPLTGLLQGSVQGRKSGPLEWGEREEHAFRQLRDAFTEVPILRHFDPTKRTRIETDASDYAVAGILSQLQEDGHWHPVAFWSRKMIAAERNYETHDKELLAIVMVFKQWRHYCEGSFYPIEVLTDHNNLKAFMGLKELNRRQARWAMKLSMFDFTIAHRTGKSNPADAPSRRPDYEREKAALDKLLPTLQQKLANLGVLSNPFWTAVRKGVFHIMEDMDEKQSDQQKGQKSMLGLIHTVLRETMVHPTRLRDPHTARAGSLGETPAQQNGNVAEEQLNPVAGAIGCKQYVPRCVANMMAADETAYDGHSGLITELIKALQSQDATVEKVKKGKPLDKRMAKAGEWHFDEHGLLRCGQRVYVPAQEAVIQELLKRHHDDPLAGHFGVDKTTELTGRKFYWPTMNQDVKEYIDSCDICQRTKTKRHRPYGELKALPMPSRPWKEISMDFITDLPPSKYRNCVYDAILVVVDRYTKMLRYIPTTKKINAVELTELFFTEIALKFGTPDGIVTDRGSVFTSAFWSDVCYNLRVKRRLSTAFHPQTDGQTERQNQSLEQYLRIYCNEQQSNWAGLLPLAEFAYHQVKQATIGCSPFKMMYGYDPEVLISIEDDAARERVPAAEERVKKLHELREKLEKRWQDAMESSAKYYNKTHKPITFNKGDLVMLSAKNLKQRRPNRKLSHKYIGPFRVEAPIGSQAYRLTLPTTYRIYPVFHVSLLEPYKRREAGGEMQEYIPPELIDDSSEYEVEEILDRTKEKGQYFYKIRWKDWSSEYDQWVHEDSMKGSKRMVEAYDKQHKRRRRA